MTLLKLQDETEWAKMVEDVNDDSDEDDEEENFAWYNINDVDTYFVLCTMTKQVYNKDDQVFHCYGRRTNQYLLRNYGFALRSNKYNSLKFKVNIDFAWKENMEKKPALKNDAQKTVKSIKLKKDKLKDEILAYFRANIMHQQDNELDKKLAKESNDSSAKHLLEIDGAKVVS
jgi:hypothetical protein